MKQKILGHIFVFLAGILVSGLFAKDLYAQNFGSGCEVGNCSNSTCQLQTTNGKLQNNCPSGTRYDVDPNCVMNNNAKATSCLDTMPVSSIKRVSETNCYRANGAGGNSTPRNHLGTDYSANSGTVVTAAADGQVVWAKEMKGAGRAIMIEHTKQCKCGQNTPNSGCDNKYITVYFHLSGYVVTGGYVKKGDPIGLVGGSNYQNGVLCDYPNKTFLCHPYGPHLHFEIHSGDWKKGYDTLKKSIIDPLCDDIQTFCGGCPYNVEDECLNKTNTNQWTDLNEDAKEQKTVANPPDWIASSPQSEATTTTSNDVCTYQKYIPSADECYFCPIFKALFNTASSMALKAYNALATGVANVVLVVFALWVSVFVLKHVSAIEVKKPSKMIQEFLVMAFKVLVVVLILRVSYFQVLRLTIGPVFNTGMAYSQAISGEQKCSTGAAYMTGLNGYETEADTRSSGALPLSMGRNILCSMKTMQDNVYKMVAFGKLIRCIGWDVKFKVKNLIPSFPYVITGDLLILAGLILLLVFPWCLMDCVLNMAVASALLPAAIGCWPFKSTKKYLSKIWDIFMNAMFQFVFLSITLYIIMTVVNQFVSNLDTYAGGANFEDIMHPFKGFPYWSINGMKLIMVCLLGWVFLDQSKKTAGTFAKALPISVAQTTGGFFAQMGNRLAFGSKGKDGKRHGGALGITKGVAKVGGLAAQGLVYQPIKRQINTTRNNRIIKNGTAVKDADGRTIAYEQEKNGLFGRKITRRVELGANGEMTYSKEKENLFGNTTKSTTKDHLLQFEEVKDQNGQVISQNMQWTTPLADYLVNNEGDVDMNILAQLENETTLPKEKLYQAVAQTVMHKRGIALGNNFQNRQISFNDGVLSIVQENSDGTRVTLSSQIAPNGQVLTNYEAVDNAGNRTLITDNGVMSRRLTKEAGLAAVATYGFSEKYRALGLLDKNGKVWSGFDENRMMYGFDAYDKTLHAQQIRDKKAQYYTPSSSQP